MADKVITATTPGPCGCCGGTPPPPGCKCALLIPPFASPYANSAAAQGVLARTATSEWATCYAYYKDVGGSGTGTITSLSHDVSVANALGLSAASTGSPGITYLWGCITVSAADLSIAYSGTLGASPFGYGFTVDLLDCATGDVIYTGHAFGSSGTISITSVAAGTYYVRLNFTALIMPPLSASLAATVTATSGALVPNPVIAQWDDSGTTRQLEACPKLLLPFLTESSDDWFASESDASDWISLHTANCLMDSDAGTDVPGLSMSASAGTNSLTLNYAHGAASGGFIKCSLNLEKDDYLNLACSVSDFGSGGWSLYDDEGNIIASGALLGSGTIVIGAATPGPPPSWPPWGGMPYTGRYSLGIGYNGTPGAASAQFILTPATGTLTANRIQALYDVGLDCPARLDCA